MQPDSRPWSWANVINNCIITAGEDKTARNTRCNAELLKLTRKARLERDIVINGTAFYGNTQPRTLRDLCRGKNIEFGSLLIVLAKNECVLHLYHPTMGLCSVHKPNDFGNTIWSVLCVNGQSLASYAKDSAYSRRTLSSIANGTNDSLAGVMLYTVLTISYELDIQMDVKYTVERKQRELEYLEKM